MKILLVSSLYGIKGGGSGVMAQHIATGLSDAGHQVSVITIGETHRYSMSNEQGVKIFRFRPVNLYPFTEKDTHPTWQRILWQLVDVYNFHSARVLRQILLKEVPDIVHINKMRGFSGAVWSVSSQLLPGRVIQTCHDYESMSPDGLMRGLIGKMALNKTWPVRGYQLIRAYLSSRVNVVTAPSKFTLKRIIDSGLFRSAQARVIPNTHGWSDNELKSIHSKITPPSDGKIRFLYIGRLESEKGIRELCEAFLRLSKSRPSTQLDIAGGGTLDAELRKSFGPCPGVRFLGMVYGKSKDEALSNATIVVVPSMVEEVFGLATIEAFAFGKPVIAGSAGGLPEVVRHDETGWLFDTGNTQALLQRLEMAASVDSLQLARMSRLCQEYSHNFSMNKIVKEYEGIYDQQMK